MEGALSSVFGRTETATARFTGETISVTSAGVTREETQAIGFTAKATAKLTLFGSYAGEFGSNEGHSLNAGLRFNF